MNRSNRRYDIDDLLPPYQNVGREERLVSAGTGAALIAAGLTRRSIAGAVLAVTGVALVARAWTGYCPFLDALGINHAHPREDHLLRDTPTPTETNTPAGGQEMREHSFTSNGAEDWAPDQH